MTLAGRVSPFGHPRINACSRLPMAYRSVPRPSSPLDAKASTKRPSLLEIRTPKQPARAQPCGPPDGNWRRLGEDSHANPDPSKEAGLASPSQSGNTSCATNAHDMPKPMPIDHVRNNALGVPQDPRGEPLDAPPARRTLKPGGAGRARTDDLLLAKQALSRLSYGPFPPPTPPRGKARPPPSEAR